jgi:hypothetical protein
LTSSPTSFPTATYACFAKYCSIFQTENALVLQQVRKYPYVIYTDYQPAAALKITPNKDITHGRDTRIWRDSGVFLDQPPFSQNIELLLEAASENILRAPGEIIRTFLLRRQK